MSQPESAPPTSVTLVDDEPTALDALVRAARSWCYECQAARSAEQALDLLEQNLTPIVVTDLGMPGQGGVWLVHEIQRRWPKVAVIVLTAAGDPEAVTQCLRGGAQHYFLKPIQLDEFQHVLEATSRSVEAQRTRDAYRLRLEHTVRRRTRQVRSTFLSAINSLVRTLEARDPYTSGHSLRVRDYVRLLARELQWDERQRRLVGLAARLHDIGKVGLPEAILNKPDALNDEEQEIVREHPAIGERILAPIVRNRAVRAAIRGHHERFDGKGYPDGLAGEQVPLLARAITVADCYDALTSARAYRGALPKGQALELLRAGAGSQFDPALLLPFLRRMARG